MTLDALAGRETSYYPRGRVRQRPATLMPAHGERHSDVLDDWQSIAADLDSVWATLDDQRWRTAVIEPANNPDLGSVPLGRLALARLTEVDVHATDLGIDAPDWSSILVEVALPTRLAWLATRRTNLREFDRSVRGSWLLHATEGPRWLVAVGADSVESRPAAEDDDTDGTIHGSSRDLLALLLGRPPLETLRFSGDVSFARSFGSRISRAVTHRQYPEGQRVLCAQPPWRLRNGTASGGGGGGGCRRAHLHRLTATATAAIG